MLPYYVKSRDLPLVEKAKNAYLATICFGFSLVLLIIHFTIYPQIASLLDQSGPTPPASFKLAALTTPLLVVSLIIAGVAFLARRPSVEPPQMAGPDPKNDLVNIQGRSGFPTLGVFAAITMIVIYLILVYILPVYSLTSKI